ncbi:MAG: M28 family peptidase [Candidatus Marinimicrobia bacterium]|nr:M28 family peptidase [Candidatus Neomarinimicrobiota bacterium]
MKYYQILLIILFSFCFAGELDDIKKDIDFLASETCRGRSLAGDGIFNAESYIKDELGKIGISTTIQSVNYKLNMTLETPICVINGDTLRPGYDFIPHPFSASVDNEFTLEEIELADSAKLASIKEDKKLYSLSSARRYMLKKSKRKDRNTLLLFTGNYPLISNQSKQYKRPALQVNKEFVKDDLNTVYMYNKVECKKVKTNNIIAIIEGTEYPDSMICVAAHYDHMGALGDIYYPGANDNASGVAVLLSLARYFADTPPPVTLAFCFFTGEEQGLKGSWQYVKKPVFPLKKVIMAINLDMVGSGLKGYGIVAGNDHPEDISIFEDIREAQGFGDLKLRHNSPNSDHFPFTDKGVPALFFYASGGEQPYHHPDDVPETLDWQAIENTVLMIKNYILQRIKR